MLIIKSSPIALGTTTLKGAVGDKATQLAVLIIKSSPIALGTTTLKGAVGDETVQLAVTPVLIIIKSSTKHWCMADGKGHGIDAKYAYFSESIDTFR